MGGAAIAGGLGAGANIFQGISSYKSSKAQAKNIKEQGRLQAQQILEEGEQYMQAQKQIATGSGYVLADDTSPLQVMLDTERQAREDADNVLKSAYSQARQVKKSGLYSMYGSLIGAGANLASGIAGGKK